MSDVTGEISYLILEKCKTLVWVIFKLFLACCIHIVWWGQGQENFVFIFRKFQFTSVSNKLRTITHLHNNCTHDLTLTTEQLQVTQPASTVSVQSLNEVNSVLDVVESMQTSASVEVVTQWLMC